MYRLAASISRGTTLAAAVILLAAACRGEREGASATRLIGDLTRTRFTVGRLAPNEHWGQCRVLDSASVVPRSSCAGALRPGSAEFAAFVPVAQRIRRQSPSDSTERSLLAEALVDLRSAGGDTLTLERAVETLQRASSKTPASIEALNALADAEIELAARTQSLSVVLGALDAADRAIGLDSTRKESLYNRALALERLYLDQTALLAWRRYLNVARDAEWRRDAEEHEAAVASALERRDSSPDPQRSREHEFALLGAWGHAHASGQVALEDSVLDSIRAEQRELHLPTGDQSMSHMLHDIAKCAADRDALGQLARGYETYVDALNQFQRAAYENAGKIFTRAARDLRPCSPSAERWASLYSDAAAVNAGQPDSAAPRLRTLLDRVPVSEPALAGKTLWDEALLLAHQGSFEQADQIYAAAARHFDVAGEEENVGDLAALRTEVLGLAGNITSEHEQAFEALRTLSRHQNSNFSNDHLVNVAEIARSTGFVHAALDIMGEGQAIAEALGRPTALVLTLCARAKDLLAIGDTALAEQAIARARDVVRAVPPGHAHDKAEADVDLATGRLLRTRNPREAAQKLATAASAYLRLKESYFIPSALFEAATASLAIGDTVPADRRLDVAIDSIERHSPLFRDAESRREYFESVEGVFDEMISLKLKSNEPEKALAYLERERSAFWQWRDHRIVARPAAERVSFEKIQRALPPDAAFVAFAVLPSQTVTWVITRAQSHVLSTPIAPDSLSRLVDDVRREATTTTGPRPASAKLFDLLFEPADQDLGAINTVFLVPDHDLAGVPFVALWDRHHERFALEEFEVRTLPSAQFFLTVRVRAPASIHPADVLVVGNPTATAGTRSNPELGVLPGAAAEARQIAAEYSNSTLLLDSEATPNSVVVSLRHASAFHFAGHAVFDQDRPDRSYLAMAPTRSSDGRLEAREISRLSLSNLQIAVLSACETLGSRSTHVGAFVGLADAFLRAGVPATVSSLWNVDDEDSAPLLVDFHRRLARGAEPGAALRAAQLTSMRGAGSASNKPAVWAAYVYTGA